MNQKSYRRVPARQIDVHTDNINVVKDLSRRQFVALFSVTAAALLMEGCGGGGGNGGPAATPSLTIAARGTVNIPGISGKATKIISAYADNPAAVSGGQFGVNVSSQVVHVILATDANNTVSGMSISVPIGGAEQTIIVDASSTAIALIFLTPGIVTEKPDEARSRLQKIANLSQYGAFRDALASAMANSALPTAVAVPGVQTAYATCVKSYIEANRSVHRRGRLITTDNSGRDDSTLNFTLGDVSSPAQVLLTISNADLRVLQVYRKDFPTSGALPTIQRLDDLTGAEGASLGSLISGQIGDPTTKTIALNMGGSGAYRVEFFFRGMGTTSNLTIASDMRNAFVGTEAVNSATIKTILWNFVVPLLNFVLGFTYAPSDDVKPWIDAISILLSDAGMADALNDFYTKLTQGANAIEMSSAAVAVAEAAFGALQTADILKEILTAAFMKAGWNGVLLFGKVALADAAVTAVGAVYAGLGGGQLIGFITELMDWHSINISAVTASGTGTVVIS